MRALPILALAILAACGSTDRDTCEPGRQVECACGGGDTGFQTCKADGSGWLECECGCVPDCSGKECGPDGCDGSCGACGASGSCDEAGQCDCQYEKCGGTCCAGGQVCSAWACCTPSCEMRECGPDPWCGSSCGDCDVGRICNLLGGCVSEQCEPDCRGLECGPDPACGLSCGECDQGYECGSRGECVVGTTFCASDDDCPGELVCDQGVCAELSPCGCNYDCDEEKSEVCNRVTHRCEVGSPPANCQTDCDCYADDICEANTCVPPEVCEVPCRIDEECEPEQVCRDDCCRPRVCADRQDCEGPVCLICQDGECTEPPQVCMGDDDCCLPYECIFGSCSGDFPCQSDSDCPDPDYPRCVDGDCAPECLVDIDCPLPGQVCIDRHCESPACTVDSCPLGQWCDTDDGQCKAGCDTDDDCEPPDTCDIASHSCG